MGVSLGTLLTALTFGFVAHVFGRKNGFIFTIIGSVFFFAAFVSLLLGWDAIKFLGVF